jgi:hypothetical protein
MKKILLLFVIFISFTTITFAKTETTTTVENTTANTTAQQDSGAIRTYVSIDLSYMLSEYCKVEK